MDTHLQIVIVLPADAVTHFFKGCAELCAVIVLVPLGLFALLLLAAVATGDEPSESELNCEKETGLYDN